MVFKFLSFIKKSKKGISLVEVIVVVFIISVFSSILIADFPNIQKQFAISRAVYKMAQEVRKAQDLGLSGVSINDANENPISVSGYGVYVYVSSAPNYTTEYVLYADVDDSENYNAPSEIYCDQSINPATDCVIDKIDLSKENGEIYIKNLENADNIFVSINFSPPSPTTTIDTLAPLQDEVGIVFALKSNSSKTRTLWVNKSGLIKIQ